MYNQELSVIESFARQHSIPVILGEGRAALEQAIIDSKPLRILEVGTAIGYSGSIMLLNSSRDTTLDTIELDPARIKLAAENFAQFNLSNRVTIYQGDAELILPQLCENRKYDFVFLDGPKGQYGAYLDIIKPALNSGGVLFADNVLFRGMVEAEGLPSRRYRTIVVNLRRFLASVAADYSLELNLYHEGDGIAIIKKI